MNTISRPAQAQFGALAPLVKEAWYVIDAASEFTREIKSRTILNEPVVYYCTEAGDPVVMDGRCPHRRFPLSQGVLKGDAISCGYHGITFSPDGDCVYAPGCANGPPQHMKAKVYATVKAGPWIWIWTGNNPPDYDALPMPQAIMDQGWNYYNDVARYEANYNLIHENLLDLTHVYFMHKFGTFDYADAPLQSLRGGRIGWTKTQQDMITIWGMMAGVDPELRGVLHSTTEVVSPGLMYSTDIIDRIDDAPNMPSRGMVMQAITPETDRSTFGFWLAAIDTTLMMPEREYKDLTDQVFGEDIIGLAQQQIMIESDHRPDIIEYSIPNDRSGLKLRQKLFSLARQEHVDPVQTLGVADTGS